MKELNQAANEKAKAELVVRVDPGADAGAPSTPTTPGDIKPPVAPKDRPDFTPQLKPFPQLHHFRAWIQAVLPQVYDDSLSYYEVLAKLIHLVNTTLDAVKALEENDDLIIEAFKDLQSYVGETFDEFETRWDDWVASQLKQWEDWKSGTMADLDAWKGQYANEWESWKNQQEQDLTSWKNQTQQDIQNWETSTVNALEVWKNAFKGDWTSWSQAQQEQYTKDIASIESNLMGYIDGKMTDQRLQAFIDNSVNNLVSNGTIEGIVKPLIPDIAEDATDAWLDAHKGELPALQLDATLTQPLQAAQAEAAGKRVTDRFSVLRLFSGAAGTNGKVPLMSFKKSGNNVTFGLNSPADATAYAKALYVPANVTLTTRSVGFYSGGSTYPTGATADTWIAITALAKTMGTGATFATLVFDEYRMELAIRTNNDPVQVRDHIIAIMDWSSGVVDFCGNGAFFGEEDTRNTAIIEKYAQDIAEQVVNDAIGSVKQPIKYFVQLSHQESTINTAQINCYARENPTRIVLYWNINDDFTKRVIVGLIDDELWAIIGTDALAPANVPADHVISTDLATYGQSGTPCAFGIRTDTKRVAYAYYNSLPKNFAVIAWLYSGQIFPGNNRELFKQTATYKSRLGAVNKAALVNGQLRYTNSTSSISLTVETAGSSIYVVSPDTGDVFTLNANASVNIATMLTEQMLFVYASKSSKTLEVVKYVNTDIPLLEETNDRYCIGVFQPTTKRFIEWYAEYINVV